jgi:hypothetical protein
MILLFILAIMALSVRKIDPLDTIVRFKEDDDRAIFVLGDMPAHVIKWIETFNDISVRESGKGSVVTSIFRKDRSVHRDKEAVDFRRLSAANKTYPKYTPADAEKIEQAAANEGIPIHVIAEGSPGEHWHIGRITWARN